MAGPAIVNLQELFTDGTVQEVLTAAATRAFGNYFPSMINLVQVSTSFDVLPLLMKVKVITEIHDVLDEEKLGRNKVTIQQADDGEIKVFNMACS
ncbi:hypothetical protein Q9233_002955 [Columba guinea]|nr:hypothetical protein Q9233_002955 [Columba guinea]